MRPTDPRRPSSAPDWRHRLVITALAGASALYCLGSGAYALRRSLVPSGQPTAPLAIGATQTASESSWRPTQTLEPTLTQAELVFPTLSHESSETPAPPAPTETPAEWPTAELSETATASTSPTPETLTPTLEPAATETAPPTEDHGGRRPTETPTPGQ